MMGFFSKIFSTDNADANASEQAATAQQAQIKRIEALLDSVNSASQHVRNYYITFLLACFYIAMIVWSTTDLMLLKDTPVTMPLLNVNLPITGFYTFAPYFFLLLHFNLLLQFSLLADKVHRFDRAVIELHDSDSGRYYYTRLFAFAFTQILSARHHSALLRFLLTLMVWITAIWLPLGTLVGLQVGFLPYHDEDILFWQRIAVMLDLLVLLIFWPVIRAPDSRWGTWIKQASGSSWLWHKMANPQSTTTPIEESENHSSGYPILESNFSILTGFCVTAFIWGIAVLPDSNQEQYVRDWLRANAPFINWQSLCKSKETDDYFFIATEWLFDGRNESIQGQKIEEQCKQRIKASILHRNLSLREQLLIANELRAEDEANLRSDNEAIRQEALKKINGLILSGRDLRYADFSGARMPRIDFVGANDAPSDLRYANFSSTTLIEARMRDTKLQNASLIEAKLQGADLAYAQLQGADLTSAQLQRADLIAAELQFSKLNRAQLQGAKMTSAYLQNSILIAANMQGAHLVWARLQGADLSWAELQGSDLSEAHLQGADLREAKLQGAKLDKVRSQGVNLSHAKLQGADLSLAELQGAYMRRTQLQGAKLENTNLELTDLSSVELGLLTGDIFLRLKEELANSVWDEKLYERIANIFVVRMESPFNNFAAKGKNIWRSDDAIEEKLYQSFLKSFANDIKDEHNHPKIRIPIFPRIQDNSSQTEYAGLRLAQDQSDYENTLAKYLIEQSCIDHWTLAGITRYRIESMVLASNFARCLLSFSDQKNRNGEFICPAMSKIDKDTAKILQKEATQGNSHSSIKSTFTCRTMLSDPLP